MKKDISREQLKFALRANLSNKKAPLILLSVILFITSFTLSCQQENEIQSQRIMPGGTVPSKLFVLEIQPEMSWHQRNMLACYQGLVNRKDTRIYYVETKQDQFWLDYYKETFDIQNEKVSNIYELLKLFSNEIDGYITYQPKSPHTLNIATTIGSLENLLPVPTDLEKLMRNEER